jgi:predicted RND superfamily exporter protein
MRERDGTVGKAVLVYPRPSHALWEGPSLAHFVDALRDIARTGGVRPARVAGSLPLSADILDSIRKDGLHASLAALAGVIVVVLLIFRQGTTSGLVILSLVTGVLWLAAAMMLFKVKINFANFIAYPITFGIGVDYAVNVMSRYVQDDARDVSAAIRSTGGAVTLCSLTTIIGYSSLLMAENRALYLFGLVAVLGEVACLSAAVIALPALLSWARGFRAKNVPAGRM